MNTNLKARLKTAYDLFNLKKEIVIADSISSVDAKQQDKFKRHREIANYIFENHHSDITQAAIEELTTALEALKSPPYKISLFLENTCVVWYEERNYDIELIFEFIKKQIDDELKTTLNTILQKDLNIQTHVSNKIYLWKSQASNETCQKQGLSVDIIISF